MDGLQLRPLAGALGAEVFGTDVTALGADGFESMRRALQRHSVLCIRDQKLSREAQIAFARRFGELDVHPIADGMESHPEVIRVEKPEGEAAYFGTSWHSDNSFFARPSALTILYGEVVPEVGGDTLFSSMERAWETLSPALRGFLRPLRAAHSAGRAYDPRTTGDAKYKGETAITYTYSERIYDEVVHPVVRTHPETGRPSLYVNPMFTQRLVGLEPFESDAILAMLHAHATRPEFTCRVRWLPGTLTIWDNRCVQHYALDDYRGSQRTMYRVTVTGEVPR